MTEFEAGVRELVARLRDFERRMKKVEDDAGALEQFVKLITPGLGFDTAGCPGAVISGTVRGTLAVAIPGAQVAVTTAGGTLLGTATTNSSGAYTLTVTLPSPVDTGGGVMGQSVVVTGTVEPAAGANYFRFGAVSATVTALCSASITQNLTIPAATGYRYITGCIVPIASTLTWNEAKYGTRTLTLVGSTWDSACVIVTWDRTAGLGGPYTTALTWRYTAPGAKIEFPTLNGTDPKVGGVCTDARNGQVLASSAVTTCANMAGTTAFAISGNIAYGTGAGAGGAAAYPYTIVE